MTTYAKLNNDGTLDLFKGISNIVYQPDELVKERASEQGYKPVIEESAPHHLAYPQYRETEKQIRRGWVELDLEAARTQQRAAIVTSCNNAYAEAMAIYSTAEIAVAQDSSDQAIAVMAATRGVPVEKQAQELSLALMMGKVINGCLAGYSLRLEDAIKSASTVAEIASIAWSRADFTVVVEEAMASAMKGGSDGES